MKKIISLCLQILPLPALQVKTEFINKILSPKATAILKDTGVSRSDTKMTSSKKSSQPSHKLYAKQTLCVCVKYFIHLPLLLNIVNDVFVYMYL